MPKYSVELAKRVLEKNPNISDVSKDYFGAVISGTLPQYYREEIQRKKLIILMNYHL